jgi:pSer/pThr/pTyr-binding forkhead associated (FHA) protein
MAPAQAAQAGFGGPDDAAGPARLVVIHSNGLRRGAGFDVGPVPVTIGRAKANVVPLPKDEFASAEHARVEAGRDGVWVIDLGSTNGTFVNGDRVDGRRRLRPGDVLHVGDTELRFDA